MNTSPAFTVKRVCVVGAGAIGGLIAVPLAQLGLEVTVIARGKHLADIKQHGLTLIMGGKEVCAKNIIATSKLSEVPATDLILLAVKAHQIEPIAAEVGALLQRSGEHCVLLALQNGLPWWYFQENPHPSAQPFSGLHLKSVDPTGALSKHIPAKHILGCIAYPAAHLLDKAVIKHVEGFRFPLGELNGKVDTPRVIAISELLKASGFQAPILPDIRSEIWLKLWGNLSFNTISALTGGTLGEITSFPLTYTLATRMMEETEAVGKKLGATFRVSIKRRIEGAAQISNHKTSMLQDVIAGRQLEVGAIILGVSELAALTNTPAPHVNAVAACVALLSQRLSETIRMPSKL